MEEERPILCMEHCKEKRIFGFFVPKNCSFCGADLLDSELKIPPFRLPSPFVEASKSPCSIVLKPTRGDFLLEYKNSNNLHIGVTNSSGIVFEYDSEGLQNNKSEEWTRCIAIKEFNKGKTFAWGQFWDFTLQAISGQNLWTKEKYNEKDHNCYNFVLSFLRALNSPDISPYTKDSRKFCEHFILKKTASTAKYITLYRKLMTET